MIHIVDELSVCTVNINKDYSTLNCEIMQSYSKNKTMEVEVIIEGPLHEPFLIIVCVNDTK